MATVVQSGENYVLYLRRSLERPTQIVNNIRMVCVIFVLALVFLIVVVVFLIVVPIVVSLSPVFRPLRMIVVSDPILDLVTNVVMHVLVGYVVIILSSLVAAGVLAVFLVP